MKWMKEIYEGKCHFFKPLYAFKKHTGWKECTVNRTDVAFETDI